MSERQFKGVWIPARIWLDRRLSVHDKVLLADIDSFTSRDASYFKSNETIMNELGVSKATAKRSVKHLHDLGYITISRDGRVRHIRTTGLIHEPHEGSEPYDYQAQNEPSGGSKRPHSNTIELNPLETPLRDKGIVYPFPSDEFVRLWGEFKVYRKEQHKFTYKSVRTEQGALNTLAKIAKDEDEARTIITRTIGNGWKGFYPIKHEGGGAKNIDVDELEKYIQGGTI